MFDARYHAEYLILQMRTAVDPGSLGSAVSAPILAPVGTTGFPGVDAVVVRAIRVVDDFIVGPFARVVLLVGLLLLGLLLITAGCGPPN
jgi:hypothetical protein